MAVDKVATECAAKEAVEAHLGAIERVDSVGVVQAERERVYDVRDVVKMGVERLELVDELPRRRLERLARCEVEVARNLIHLCIATGHAPRPTVGMARTRARAQHGFGRSQVERGGLQLCGHSGTGRAPQ